MISDVAYSVVVAFQDGCSTHYVAAWLVKIDQIRKTYNSAVKLETSPSVLISNCITLNYFGTCYFYCCMWQYACSKRQQRYHRSHAADTKCSSTLLWTLSHPDAVPLFVQPMSLALYRSSSACLTLILLTCRIWWSPHNASKWQMGFNSALNPYRTNVENTVSS
jgi:hypothetical protein